MKRSALHAALAGKTPRELAAIHALATRLWLHADRARRHGTMAVCEHVLATLDAVAVAQPLAH